MKVQILPCLKDNYIYLLTTDDGTVGVIDPGEAAPVIDALRDQSLLLNYIFNTHHHGDHIGGNAELIAQTGVALIGPAAEAERIAGMDIQVQDGDVVPFGSQSAQVIATPGHTHGHVCYYFAEAGMLFIGDALFSMGTGRLFEGTADEMFEYLQILKGLPDETLVYCGHEYTQANAAFCLSVEPDNAALQERAAAVDALRAAGKPTLPVTLGVEKQTNVFLRAGSAEELADLRARKEAF